MHFLDNYILFIAMAAGCAFGVAEVSGWWAWTAPSWCLPVMICLMLFFTFCKLNPAELRLNKWHWLLLVFQIVVSLALFYALRPVSLALAQGVMLCVFMPSATAAPIITGKLGGSIRTLTSFTLLSSASAAVLVPLVFPLMTEVNTPFLDTFLVIVRQISPMLLAPFFAAWLLRVIWQRARHTPFVLPSVLAALPFYLWAGTLVILMAQMVRSLACYDGDMFVLAALFAGALVTCLLQFAVGRLIGKRFPSPPADEEAMAQTAVSAGQALGQKNTTLGVWLAATYLIPVSALAPAAYILWQNFFNSWQLARAGRASGREEGQRTH